jgi:hypothetical protein
MNSASPAGKSPAHPPISSSRLCPARPTLRPRPTACSMPCHCRAPKPTVGTLASAATVHALVLPLSAQPGNQWEKIFSPCPLFASPSVAFACCRPCSISHRRTVLCSSLHRAPPQAWPPCVPQRIATRARLQASYNG